MQDNENSVLVGNLKGGQAHYKVCLEDEYLAEKAMDSNSVELLTNCIDIDTQPDYHTLAGWIIALFLCCVAVFFMYTQREKIEILYFNRQIILPVGLAEIDIPSLQNNHNQNQSTCNMNSMSSMNKVTTGN